MVRKTVCLFLLHGYLLLFSLLTITLVLIDVVMHIKMKMGTLSFILSSIAVKICALF